MAKGTKGRDAAAPARKLLAAIADNCKECPRCKGLMPKKDVGVGVALSRRGGRVNICAECGGEEGLLDAGILKPEPSVLERERRVKDLAGANWRQPRWWPK